MELNKLINEELSKLLDEAKKKEPEITKKLEDLRKKFIPVMDVRESQGEVHARPERRVLLKTVADLIEVPMNELMLHFLNNVKNNTENSLVEYHLGQVYFYGEVKSEEVKKK
jgi:hypothetical protein